MFLYGTDRGIAPLFLFSDKNRKVEKKMKRSNSPVWGSLPILIGVMIGILAIVRGKWQASLLTAVLFAWGAWVVMVDIIPERRRRQQLRELDEQKKFEQQLISETGLSERELANLVLYHVNFRVSAVLRSKYPNASWEWTMERPALFAVNGGTGRIRVYGVLGYDYADVTLDNQANIRCSLVQLAPVQNAEGTPSNQRAVNPQAWYETQAKEHLTALMNDLNSRGHTQLFIKENGDVCIQPQENGKEIRKGTLSDFPAKVYWQKLVEVFAQNGIDALMMDDRIQIAW